MNTNDQTISHKLDQLDTLGGGIVFGREEAWDKLQTRMEEKPARKVSLYYGVAAAVLLLISCSFFMLRQPEQQIAVHTQPQQSVEIAPTTQRPTVARPANEKSGSIINKMALKEGHHNSTPGIAKPEIIKCPPSEPTVIAEEERTPADPIRIASAKPMRIVHINELDKDASQVATPAPATASVTPKKMKVVTMLEVLREDQPTREPFRSSMPLVKALFRQDNYVSTGNTPSVQNPLNIKINLQN